MHKKLNKKIKQYYQQIIKRVNNITFIDVIFIVTVIFISSYALNYFMRKRVTVFVDLTFQRQEWNEDSFPPEYWQVINIKNGDEGYNSVGRQVAKVVEVEKNIYGGGERMYFELTVELDAVYNSATKTYVFDGNPLMVGRELTLQLNNTEFTGNIKNVYENMTDRFSLYKKAKAMVKVHYEGYDIWHAEALRDFEARNSRGEIVARVVDFEIEPARFIVTTDRGDVLVRTNPLKRDMTVEFELPRVICLDKMCFFNDYQSFMVGDQFWADSGKTYFKSGSIMSSEIIYEE